MDPRKNQVSTGVHVIHNKRVGATTDIGGWIDQGCSAVQQEQLQHLKSPHQGEEDIAGTLGGKVRGHAHARNRSRRHNG